MNFPSGTLVLVLALVVVGWLLRGWRFYYYLRSNGDAIPLRYSISSFLAGFALTSTPGKLGEAVKAVILKEDYGVPVTRVVGIVMMERLMDLAGVLLLASFSVLLFRGWEHVFLVCAVLVIAGGAFLCMESLYRPVLEWLGKFRILSKICSKILVILETGRSLVTGRILAVGLLVSSLAWGTESVSLYLILQGFNLKSTLLQANFVYCISTLFGALSMLPGGIGGTEAGMVGLLKFMGISYTEGLPSVLLIRVCTLWFAIAVGVGFMAAMLAGWGRTKS
jgi:uncharacterized protein (TIRG00374 family)